MIFCDRQGKVYLYDERGGDEDIETQKLEILGAPLASSSIF